MPVSADTLLRTLRRRSAPTPISIKIIGLDDFAWRRGHRYGTIVCDLERRRIIDLLADREIGTVTARLKDHPDIELSAATAVVAPVKQRRKVLPTLFRLPTDGTVLKMPVRPFWTSFAERAANLP